MVFSKGNLGKYLDENGLNYLINQLEDKFANGGNIDLSDYYTKEEIDTIIEGIPNSGGSDGIGIQSVQLVDYELIITLTDNTVYNLGNVRGEQGIQGIQGIQGADGQNGTDGIDGKNGIDGLDGISPTVAVTNITNGHNVAITDVNGTQSFDVLNGKDGTTGSGGGGVADIQIATNDAVGVIKGNEGEINIDIGGQMSIPSDFTPQETLEAVTGTEDKKTFFGKVAKVITDFIAHAANLSIHFGLTNNLLATEAGTALDAVQGKELDTRVTTNTNDIDTLNRNLTKVNYKVIPAFNNVSIQISSNNILIHVKAVINFSALSAIEEWANYKVGSISNWTGTEFNFNLISAYNSEVVRLTIKNNGEIIASAQKNIVAHTQWFYGDTSILI